MRETFRMESSGWMGATQPPPHPPLSSLLTSLKGLGMAESISTLMKESSPSAERLELSAEVVWEMTRLVSLFFLLSDSSFLFCWVDVKKRREALWHHQSFHVSGNICVQLVRLSDTRAARQPNNHQPDCGETWEGSDPQRMASNDFSPPPFLDYHHPQRWRKVLTSFF